MRSVPAVSVALWVKFTPVRKKSAGVNPPEAAASFVPHDFISLGRFPYSFWNSGRTKGVRNCVADDSSTDSRPTLPDFVLIITAPWAAAEP